MKMLDIEMNEGVSPYVDPTSMNLYHSVEFSVNGLYFLYQVKIHNPTASSMGVRIRENSEIMGSLRVGDVIKMKYYPKDAFNPVKLMETVITHIEKENEGRFQGHYFIGLSLPHQDSHKPLH